MIKVDFGTDCLLFTAENQEEYTLVYKTCLKYETRTAELECADSKILYKDMSYALMYVLRDLDEKFKMVMVRLV